MGRAVTDPPGGVGDIQPVDAQQTVGLAQPCLLKQTMYRPAMKVLNAAHQPPHGQADGAGERRKLGRSREIGRQDRAGGMDPVELGGGEWSGAGIRTAAIRRGGLGDDPGVRGKRVKGQPGKFKRFAGQIEPARGSL